MRPTKKLVISLFRLLTITAGLFVFAVPAFAYEEDTHFNMTYVVCRSVGFTPQEAMIVAAADQGMDDSSGTVANGGIGGIIPNIPEEWMWHALDRDGNMLASGVLARRDKLFQAALKETTVRNKLIRLGVFFHFEQDTWAHRHHYDANHLSRTNYTTYNTPFGHARDFHQPDRPPFDPVAALENLEDNIVFARQFLQQGLGRAPGAFLANYVPQGDSQDSSWKDDGMYFHQISTGGAPAGSPRAYLIALIRAQIDSYSSSIDPTFGFHETANEADVNSVRMVLNNVCLAYLPFRSAGISFPSITIPTTSQKEAQGLTSLSSAMLNGSLPNLPRFVGVGTNKLLYTRTTLTSPWVQVPNSGLVTSIAIEQGGTILGIGTDKFLYTRANLTSKWVQVANSGLINGVTAFPSGAIVGVGTDNFLYNWVPALSKWIQVPNSGAVTAIANMPDGTLLGVGTDKLLYTRAALTSTWVQVPNSGSVTAITVLQDGTILGIGTDQLLYTRATLNGNYWVQIPNSGAVTGIAEMPLAK